MEKVTMLMRKAREAKKKQKRREKNNSAEFDARYVSRESRVASE